MMNITQSITAKNITMKSHTLIAGDHHDSTAEKHEDHHDEGHKFGEKHPLYREEHEHEDHSTEKHQDGHKEDHR